MRWPWQRHEPEPDNGESAARSRAEAQRRLEAAKRRQPEVDAVSRALRRRRDEFARLVEEALRGT